MYNDTAITTDELRAKYPTMSPGYKTFDDIKVSLSTIEELALRSKTDEDHVTVCDLMSDEDFETYYGALTVSDRDRIADGDCEPVIDLIVQIVTARRQKRLEQRIARRARRERDRNTAACVNRWIHDKTHQRHVMEDIGGRAIPSVRADGTISYSLRPMRNGESRINMALYAAAKEMGFGNTVHIS